MSLADIWTTSEERAQMAAQARLADAAADRQQKGEHVFDRSAYENPNAGRRYAEIGGALNEGHRTLWELQNQSQMHQGTWRQGQVGLMQMLQEQAAGGGPSLATQQFQANTQASLAQAAALQASQRGVNPAMAARQAQFAQAGVQAQASQQSAMMRVQEQLAAREQLGALMQQGRAGDLAATGQLADLERYQHALVQHYLGMNMSLDQAQMAARIQLEQDLATHRAQGWGTANIPFSPYGPTAAETVMGGAAAAASLLI